MFNTTSSAKPLTVYFDGACPICAREISVYRGQKGAQACDWIDAASCPDEALGPGLNRHQALGRFHVRRADGQLLEGMRGFAALWSALPRTAWLGRVASWKPMAAALDVAYWLFLKLRPLWRPLPSRYQGGSRP